MKPKKSRFLMFLYISKSRFAVMMVLFIIPERYNYEVKLLKFMIYSAIQFLNKRISMERKVIRYFCFLIVLQFSLSGYSQETMEPQEIASLVADSLLNHSRKADIDTTIIPIQLTVKQSVDYLIKFNQQRIWKIEKDTLRVSLERLLTEATNSPLDSTIGFLNKFQFDSLKYESDLFHKSEPDITSTDSTLLQLAQTPDSLVQFESPANSILFRSDSLKTAVNSIIRYLEKRDSSLIFITGPDSYTVPVWLNSKPGTMNRFWLRSDLNDSVTVWIGTQARDTIGIYLENGISFRRLTRQVNQAEARIEVERFDNFKLQEVKKITVKKDYWKNRTEANFTLNQTMLTNWVKGGESSISTALDLTTYADYNNPELKLTSKNYARFKFGFLKSGDTDLRKNLDLLETNSKLNHKAFGKFDFSAIMLFKTQAAVGRVYNKDGTKTDVSKFFNPAMLTLGLGLDYKPNKTTSLNFSPLSYKATFVPDTAGLDETRYGIPAGKRSMHEPGASFLITNEFKPVKTVTVTNRLQLFTNYINNPQNIDIDWEMILTANLNWFTDVRLNTHFIFDDDTKTTEFDKDGNQVLGSDGKPRKSARVQFKEMIGFSFVFRF